jgi:ribosomal protein L13
MKKILRTIKGMLPKNKLRKQYLSKVQIFEEAAHNLHQFGLPQFNICENVDYNKLLQHPEQYPENYEIVATNLEDDNKSI